MTVEIEEVNEHKDCSSQNIHSLKSISDWFKALTQTMRIPGNIPARDF